MAVLHHDMYKLSGNAPWMAGLENGLGVCAIYYLCCVPQSFGDGIMREIAEMGHEIGYRYEDMGL